MAKKKSPPPTPAPRGNLRELRRQRVHEIFAEIATDAGRHEREAARALSEMAEAGAQVGFDARALAPGRRIGREVSARQERVLAASRILEPYETRLREAPDDLAAVAAAVPLARAGLADARATADEALARVAEASEAAATAAASSLRTQMAAVNLALAASRAGEEQRPWIDHAERVRSQAAAAAAEAEATSARFESLAGAIRGGVGQLDGAASALESLGATLDAESAAALEASESGASLRSRLAKIRDDCMLQGLLVHELEQIEEEARVDEGRGRELLKTSRAALRPRVAEAVGRALARLEREIGAGADGLLPPLEELRSGIEAIRVAAADHEQQIGRLSHVQADLLALRRRQGAILSAFPKSTDELGKALADLAQIAEGARGEVTEAARRLSAIEGRAAAIAEDLARSVGAMRRASLDLLETPARAAVFGRVALHADLLVAIARLAAGYRGAGIQQALEAVEEGAREAATSAGRLGGTWQAAEADLRRAASLVEESASWTRLLARRLGRTREGLTRAQGHLVALVVAAGEMKGTLDAAPEWKEETLRAIEEVASRAETSRRAAEEAGRSGSRLRLELRALEASADELEHLSGLV